MGSWIWFIGGIGFLGLELFVPVGFFFFLLGCSAILVGGCVALGVLPTMNLQLGAFAIMAVAFPVVFAFKLRQIFPRKVDGSGNDTIGQKVIAQGSVMPGAIGTGQLWGSPWRIKNVGTEVVHKDQEVTVVAAEGVTLMVKAHSE